MAPADRSNHPSFYDPEHPDNLAPSNKELTFCITLLCDDGETYTWEGWATDTSEAVDIAWDHAVEHNMIPVELSSVE